MRQYNGSSTSISHLAAQASVSAEALRDDLDFRSDAAGKWPLAASAFPIAQINPSQIEVRICIGSNKTHLSELPFFAKLTLVQRGEKIKSLGYNVQIELFEHIAA